MEIPSLGIAIWRPAPGPDGLWLRLSPLDEIVQGVGDPQRPDGRPVLTLLSCAQDGLCCLQSVGQRRFDRADIRARVERLAGEEDRSQIGLAQQSLSGSRFWRGIGICSAREAVVASVDRARGDEIAPETVRTQIENLGERGKPHLT